jgi:hypothetical protein
MRTKAGWLSAVTVTVVLVVLGLAFAGAPLAQTTSTVDVRNFEVISVDGNKLVVRDERGTQELTVPDDFRFTIDGKKMSVSELKAGMKGTATVTTTTTVKPVFVTELREGEVLRASPISMTVRTADGTRKFTQTELDTKGIRIYKDGSSVRLSDLKKGDKLSATVVTYGAPAVLTEKEVQAVLAEPEPAPTTVAAAAPAQPATPAASPQPTTPPPAPPPASPPAEQSGLGLTWWLVIAVLIALVVFFVRRRKQA